MAERLGDEVIEFKGVSKGFGDRLLIDDLSFQVPAGAIVGIIGPNGAGKSTLFRMITGKEQPDTGEVVIGPTVKMAYVDQSREALEDDKTVFDDVAGGADILNVGKFEMPSAAPISAASTSRAATRQKIVGNLSGGERGRLHLAKTLIAGRQRAAAGRAVQRPRRGNPARAGRRAAGVRRLRAGDLPRPLVPRPHRHPHPRLRRRLAMELLRRQLPGIRGRQE